MTFIPGYRVTDTVYESESSIVYSAQRESDNQGVFLKLLNRSYPRPAQIEQLRHEFEVTQLFRHDLNEARRAAQGAGSAVSGGGSAERAAIETAPGRQSMADAARVHADVVQTYAIAEHQHRWFIVMEDCGGSALSTLLREREFELEEVLAIATALAGLLGRVHDAGVVHKDITSSNVVYDRGSGELRLIDFGISSRRTKEATAFYGSSSLVGTPAYLSPEQTGRMNRSIDYRSDFYSFGVLLYELLTGELPFKGSDLMELVHCHVAKPATPPHLMRPSIPTPLSKIVQKLMAKNVEDRFQSSRFLQAELQRCLDVARGVPPPSGFRTALRDVPSFLQIPERLFGREAELARLESAFERVRKGTTHLVLISGPAGAGKTRLVEELHRPVTAQRGNFAEGKSELLKRSAPYGAFVQAFRQLANHVLTLSEDSLESWRQLILDAVHPNASLIVDLIPEFSPVLGPTPRVPELSPTESRNRFRLAFQNLVGAFATASHPLVLFLDDLQWADGATFELIETLVAGGQRAHLMLVGAYRDTEIGTEHRFAQTLEKVDLSGVMVERIALEPLVVANVEELVIEALGLEPSQAEPLARLLHDRTGGNPFYVGAYLRMLDDTGALSFDVEKGWRWDPSSARSLEYVSDTIGDLLEQRFNGIAPDARMTLHWAACLGARFKPSLLATLRDIDVDCVERHLLEAHEQNLVRPIAAVVTRSEPDASHLSTEDTYRFVHDQFQDAAYNLASAAERLEHHRMIGRALLDSTNGEHGEQSLFEILHHLNLCGPQGATVQENDRIAQLNLRAARHARASAAFGECFGYANHGITFARAAATAAARLAGDGDEPNVTPWSRHYDLTIELFLEAAQSAYLNQKFEQMEQLLVEVLENAGSAIDRVRAHEVQAMAQISRGYLDEGVQTGVMALALLGVTFPKHPQTKHVALSYMRTRLAVLGRSIASLRAMRPIEDPKLLAIFRIFRKITAAAYLARPDLFKLIVLKQVQLSARHGNTAESALAYGCFALVLGGVMGNFPLGTQFGRLALEILEDFNATDQRPRVQFLHNYFIRPWTEPFANVLGSLLATHELAMQVGDFEYAAYLLDIHAACSYHCGVELPELDQTVARHIETIELLGQERTSPIVRMRWQAVRSFIEPASEPWRMVGSVCDSEALRARLEASNDAHGVLDLLVNKLVGCYHFYNYDEALVCLEGIEQRLDSLGGEVLAPLYYFYCSLVHLARYSMLEGSERRGCLKKIVACRGQLRKWAESAPANYRHKLLLVDALLADIQNRPEEARELFDQAVEAADKSGFVHELGLINELAGASYLRQRREHVARHYLRDAQYSYERWGARRRVTALIERYPELKLEQSSAEPAATTSKTGDSLDSMSVLKSTGALSGEMALDELLVKLMRVLIENAGAQLGVLVLPKGGDWFIEAEGSNAGGQVEVLSSVRLGTETERGHRVPESLIRYVIRTKRELVVNDSPDNPQFQADPYVAARRPASMLCLPLLRQGTLTGVLYLENQIARNVFTPERLAALKVLAAQASISIENARLFTNMKSLTEAQGRFVPHQFLDIMRRDDIGDVTVGEFVERVMSVLFCDLRGFTPLAERLPPETTVAILNRYFKVMEGPIGKHGGFIDAFTGDEIMALFDGPADNAVLAAQAMFGALEQLNSELGAAFSVELRMGVGINTGALLLGTVGGGERMKCGVVGDTVNLASRIEGLTKTHNAKILISEATYDALKRPDQFAIRELGRVTARGKTNEITLFEVAAQSSRARDGDVDS